MAFIERIDPTVLNIKLTSKGRELLSNGKLEFSYYALGDSEIDYNFNREIVADSNSSGYTAFDSTILRAADNSPEIISYITKTLSGSTINALTNNSVAYKVENTAGSIGFFTNNNTEFIIDSNHVKQPDGKINMSGVTGGNTITLVKASTYGTSGEEPAVGDILFVQWLDTINATFIVDKNNPTANLFYRITGITGTLASGSVNIDVDREIPNFGGISVESRAMIYYNENNFSGDTVLNMSSTDYLSKSVITFLENSQSPTIIFPYWKMSIIYTEEIAGVQINDLKYTQFKNKSLGGFVSYIQEQAPIIKKMGVIHYTNSSPANVYAEGFLRDTAKIIIPTIMWHKSTSKTLGTTLSSYGSEQTLPKLKIKYYNLADENGNVVGKVFKDLKIFVIEDQELLFAMSYKSNRSWTLPNYDATNGSIVAIPCI